jgi:hypothetical protein
MNGFHTPTPQVFDDLVREQGLDALQAHELSLVLYHVDEDLKAHRKRLEGRKPRAELIWRLKRIARILADLEYEMRRWGKTLNDFLPMDAGEEIGVLVLQRNGVGAQERNTNP